VIDGRIIQDAHCHAWRRWPFPDRQPPPADASAEALLASMDGSGVDRALLIGAATGSQHGDEYANDDNNDYLADCASRYPDRFDWVVDVDSWWMKNAREPGAGKRLIDAQAGGAVGFTHYTQSGQPLLSTALVEMFEVASTHNLFASLPVRPAQYPNLRLLAERFPSVPILVHHMGEVIATPAATDALISMANLPNVWLKFSGYHSALLGAPALSRLLERVWRKYTGRVVWGSDYPLGTDQMTYDDRLHFAARVLSAPETLGVALSGLVKAARTADSAD
jgi:L-fuconolactonase